MNSYQKLKLKLELKQKEVSELRSDLRRVVMDHEPSVIAKWTRLFEIQKSQEIALMFGERKTLQQQKGSWDEKTQTGRMGGLIEVIQENPNE